MLEFQRLVVGVCFSNGNLKVYSEMVSINDNVRKLLCCVCYDSGLIGRILYTDNLPKAQSWCGFLVCIV